MRRRTRSLFPWLAGVGVVSALGWALNRGQLPPADFTFVNGAEVKSFDPAVVTGLPENRMINALFEGLVQWHPETLEPTPGVAERWELSDDQLEYTFFLRRNARWSDGSPVTADDFHYSMRRFLDPRTGAEYAYQAWYIKNARRYTGGAAALTPGNRVEVELVPSRARLAAASPGEPPAEITNTLRGDLLHGRLIAVQKHDSDNPLQWRFTVEIDGRERHFRYADVPDDAAAEDLPPTEAGQWCRQILLDFREVGVESVDRYTLRITLEHPTPYFLNILGFYPLFPVQRACVEKYGSPHWTHLDHIVCNGPFTPLFRQLRDRTRLVKSDTYWNRENVKLNSVDVLATESSVTGLNLYLTGEVDWIYDVPPSALRVLRNQDPPRDDLNPQPVLNTYFYLLNTTRKPLDDVRVRKALSLGMDRGVLTGQILGGGEQPAYSLVPPAMPGYAPAETEKENVESARRLLAAAGYPGGRGFPPLEISYNTHETHQVIAELIRQQWQRNLGIRVKTRNEEFATLLSNQRALNFYVSRLGWIADYADPNTYLDMYVTGGENNRTGFSSAEYDQLIADAAREPDSQKRMALFQRAEAILMDEMPIIPFYFYVSKSMVKPYVRGFFNNYQDQHPLHAIWIDQEQRTPNEFLRGRRR